MATASLWPTGEPTYYAWDAGGQMAGAEPSITATVSFSYNADRQRVLKDSSAGPTAYLYDLQRIRHETDDVGGEVTRTYACSTTDEFGDLIGEAGEFEHVYERPGQHRRTAMRSSSASTDRRKHFAHAEPVTILAAVAAKTTLDVSRRPDRTYGVVRAFAFPGLAWERRWLMKSTLPPELLPQQ